MKKSEYIYIGMDVHKETHTAILMNSKEDKIGAIKIKNNIAGFKRLSAYVETFRQNLTLIYGLEEVTHFGRDLAICLLENDCIVKEVNSALSYMERMSHATVKKNDTWDYQSARDKAIQSTIRTIRNNREEMKQIEMIEADMLKELDYQLETMPGIKSNSKYFSGANR